MSAGTQSPPLGKQEQLGQGAPGDESAQQMSQEQQRPEASGAKPAETPGSAGNDGQGVLEAGNNAASKLGEQGGSRHEIETGKASQ